MKQYPTLAGFLLVLAFLLIGCQKEAIQLNEKSAASDAIDFRTPATSFDLYLLHPKTGETMQVTQIPLCGEFDASISHNSRLVAHDAFFDPGHHIYVTDIQTKESKLLPGAEGGDNASWSPNGKWIAFAKNGARIYILPSEGGIPQEVAIGNEVGWSPDSKKLVFDRGNNEIFVHNLETGVETFLCEGNTPAWSSNGSTIAYCRNGQLFLIPVDGTGAPMGVSTQLTNCPDPVGKPSWSNNGKMIAFVSGNETDSYDIWRVLVEDGACENLTNTPNFHEFDPDWSPNGRFIVFSRGPI